MDGEGRARLDLILEAAQILDSESDSSSSKASSTGTEQQQQEIAYYYDSSSSSTGESTACTLHTCLCTWCGCVNFVCCM